MIQNNLQLLLEKEMNRKKFLATVGVIMLSILGVTGFLKKLTDPELSLTPGNIKSADGTNNKKQFKTFGSSVYGG